MVVELELLGIHSDNVRTWVLTSSSSPGQLLHSVR